VKKSIKMSICTSSVECSTDDAWDGWEIDATDLILFEEESDGCCGDHTEITFSGRDKFDEFGLDCFVQSMLTDFSVSIG